MTIVHTCRPAGANVSAVLCLRLESLHTTWNYLTSQAGEGATWNLCCALSVDRTTVQFSGNDRAPFIVAPTPSIYYRYLK